MWKESEIPTYEPDESLADCNECLTHRCSAWPCSNALQIQTQKWTIVEMPEYIKELVAWID